MAAKGGKKGKGDGKANRVPYYQETATPLVPLTTPLYPQQVMQGQLAASSSFFQGQAQEARTQKQEGNKEVMKSLEEVLEEIKKEKKENAEAMKSEMNEMRKALMTNAKKKKSDETDEESRIYLLFSSFFLF